MVDGKSLLTKLIIFLLVIIIILIIYFLIPVSPIKSEIENDLDYLIQNNQQNSHTITENDFKSFPKAIQMYIKNNGFVESKAYDYMNINFKNIDFAQGPERNLRIDYTQYNFSKNPQRIAYIKSSMMGVPFEGYDYFIDGKCGMKGMIAKAITIFHEKGDEMDQAGLATYLAESLFIPSSLLSGYIRFEEIDDFNVKAYINYKDLKASGIFTFNSKYEMVEFRTNDRYMANGDGTLVKLPWIAKCSDYKVNKDGINLPGKLQAVWEYPDRELVYFDGLVHGFIYK